MTSKGQVVDRYAAQQSELLRAYYAAQERFAEAPTEDGYDAAFHVECARHDIREHDRAAGRKEQVMSVEPDACDVCGNTGLPTRPICVACHITPDECEEIAAAYGIKPVSVEPDREALARAWDDGHAAASRAGGGFERNPYRAAGRKEKP